MDEAVKFYSEGPVEITRAGSLKIGRVTMQRKGGDGGRETAKMLQFKIDPVQLFDAGKVTETSYLDRAAPRSFEPFFNPLPDFFARNGLTGIGFHDLPASSGTDRNEGRSSSQVRKDTNRKLRPNQEQNRRRQDADGNPILSRHLPRHQHEHAAGCHQ
jgi:hypothetical protein